LKKIQKNQNFFANYLHISEKSSTFAIEMKAYCYHNALKFNNMAQSAMTIRLDTRTKTQFDSLCEQFGMSANAAINVFINAVVRSRAIPFTIRVDEDPVRQRALDAFYATPRENRPEMTLDEINEEIRKARQERRERQKARV
jgi:DNA-damage-inducible protein J